MRYALGVALLIAATMSTLGSAPARAEAIPSAQADGWGHFIGCFSVLLDDVAHAQYCGPSIVPHDFGSLVESEPVAPTPIVPECGICGGGAMLTSPADAVLVAELSEHWLPPRQKRKGWLLQACCPINSS